MTRLRRVALGCLGASLQMYAAEARSDERFVCPADSVHNGREALAHRLFEEGLQREASDPEGAFERYQCAAGLTERPAVELRVGVVGERLLKYEAAADAFERYLKLAGRDAPDAARMRQHIDELRRRIAEGAKTPDPPPPVPAPAPAPKPLPIDRPASTPAYRSDLGSYVGWGLVGLGSALALTGGVLLFDSQAKNDDVHALPAGTRWASDDARGTFDAAKTEQVLGIVGLAAGPLIALGGALVLWGRRTDAHVVVLPNRAYAGLRLGF